MIVAAYTWAEWAWAGIPMFFVGWFGRAVHDIRKRWYR